MTTSTTRRHRSRSISWMGASIALAATSTLVVLGALAPAGTVSASSGDTADGRFEGGGLRDAGSVLKLDVAGRAGTPRDALAVALNLTVTQAAGPGYATVYPCGSRRPDASTINFAAGTTVANGVIASVGRDGQVCVYTSERTHLIADVSGALQPGSGFRARSPERLLDTRSRATTFDGRFVGAGRRGAGEVLELDVAGRGQTPGAADAVALNLTVTDAVAAGFATVFPCGSQRPNASTINFDRGTTIANGVIASIGHNGKVCIYTSAPTHLVADVSGSFTSGYRGSNPARLLDTRPGEATVDGRFAGGGARDGDQVLELVAAGRAGASRDAAALALNLTITQADGPGFATVYPCGSRRPDASTINFDRGMTVANSVIASVGRDGKVCLYTSARTHVIVDVSGVFRPGSGYQAQTPARLLDTRPPAPPPQLPSAAAAGRSLELLNDLRARYGAGPVVADADLSRQALAWSEEMPRSGFRHSSAGYAENIAWHSDSSMSPAAAAEALHRMWVDSPGHFRNMIDPRWKRVGIGMHVETGWYGTHMFD